MSAQTNIMEHLPLTEATYLIMLSLATEPRHGYAIMKEVQKLSEARVRLSTGTLYGALKRLLEMGWIVRAEGEDSVTGGPDEAGRPRIAYELTDLGRRVLDAEVARLRVMLFAARLRTAEEPL